MVHALARRAASILLVTALVVVLAVGACGDDDDRGGEATEPTTTETPPTVGAGPIVSGNYAFTGGVELSGTYQVRYPADDERFNTCARIAGADAESYIVPVPTFHEEIRFVWVAALAQYEGPGSYGLADLGQLTVSVRENADATPRPFQSGAATAATLQVDETNTGTFDFIGLIGAGGDELAGSLSWTCA